MPDIKFVKSIFGADLTTVIKAHKSPVPMVVEKCVKEIESRGEIWEHVCTYLNPFSAGTAFMLMQTGWIQASRRVTRRLA